MFYPRLYHCHLSTWKLFQLLNPSHFLNIITFLCRFRNKILKGKTPNPPISCHFTYKKLMNMLKSEKKNTSGMLETPIFDVNVRFLSCTAFSRKLFSSIIRGSLFVSKFSTYLKNSYSISTSTSSSSWSENPCRKLRR